MADVDMKDNDEQTALHQAAKNGHEAVVQLLLKHMVDVDANDDGRTALHWVAENGHEVEVRLLEYKVDVDAKTISKKMALLSGSSE
jgi:ankyrin repeat protein